MQKMIWSLVFAFALIGFLFQPVYAQQQIKIGTDVPLQFGLGYKYTPDYGVGAGLKVGILTEPHSSIILAIMEAMGTKKAIVDIIRNGFQLGLVLDGSASWHWKKNYVGANVVYLNLSAGEAPSDVIDDNYNFNLSSYYNPLSSVFTKNSMKINLKSNLLQLGAHYGRRVPLNEKLELQLEFGLTMNLGSTNKFTSDFPYPQLIYNTLDQDLRAAYKKYAIIPTLGVYLVYNL